MTWRSHFKVMANILIGHISPYILGNIVAIGTGWATQNLWTLHQHPSTTNGVQKFPKKKHTHFKSRNIDETEYATKPQQNFQQTNLCSKCPSPKTWNKNCFFTCEVTGGSTLVSTSSATSTGAAGAVGSDGSGGTTCASSVPPGERGHQNYPFSNQLLEGFWEYLHLYMCTIVIQLYIIYIYTWI